VLRLHHYGGHPLHSYLLSPSRHERETEGEATFHSRVGRPRRAGGRSDATTIVVENQPQRTTSTTAAPRAPAGIDATLLAACQLLNNPPPSGSSPSAEEQWHHNVDQLVVTAINTSLNERQRQPSAQHSRNPSAARAPSVARAPSIACAPLLEPNTRLPAHHRAPMASYVMAYLRAEINHHRGGEDNRITIERQHERR
jgi:hypothetical protein